MRIHMFENTIFISKNVHFAIEDLITTPIVYLLSNWNLTPR